MTDSTVTLITGGSSGIGAETARRLLDDGQRVAVTARRPERLEAFAADLGDPEELLSLPGDASDPEAVSAAVTRTVERFGRLDNAVANAGHFGGGPLAEGDPEQWRDMVLTNVLGPALLIRYALEELKRTRGRIVLVGSVAGIKHTPGNFYGATKWAVTGLAENARLAVTDDGVGVTLVNPAAVDTDFWTPLGGKPDRAMLSADAVAKAICWALSQPSGVDVNTLTMRVEGAPA